MIGRPVRNLRPSDEAEILPGQPAIMAFVVSSVERGVSSRLSFVAGQVTGGVFARAGGSWDSLIGR